MRETWDEEALVIAARRGDIRAFDALAIRYRHAVWLVARPIVGADLAEDITQDTLLLAYKALPRLEEVSRFGPWIRSIARHRALRVRSEESRSEPVERSALDAVLIRHSRSLGTPQDAAYEASWLRSLVSDLPDEYRQAAELHYFEGWPLEQVSSFLGLPVSTLKWRLFQARGILRRRMSHAEECNGKHHEQR